MLRRPRVVTSPGRLLALTALLLLVPLTGSSPAAKRQVPFGFVGTVVDPALVFGEEQATLDRQYALMAANGVESVRTNFFWSEANPLPGVYDWTKSDRIMLAAAKYRLDVMPIMQFTPHWISTSPTNNPTIYPPRDFDTFRIFMQAVERYGPRGTFWTEHPELPRTPIRRWQMWNEPAGDYNWRVRNWAPPYVKLLKAGYRGVKAVDPGATVVSGAIVGLTEQKTPWGELTQLYRLGARRYMDVVAVNSFAAALHGQSAREAVDRNLGIPRRVRRVMVRNGDAKKPIYITEITWSSALGKIPRKDLFGYETTQLGQAQRLATYYRKVVRSPELGIKRVFWYTWFSAYQSKSLFSINPTFQYTGLVSHAEDGTPFVRKPLLSAYARVAAQLQGCRKKGNARVCR